MFLIIAAPECNQFWSCDGPWFDVIVNPLKKCPLDRGPVIGVGSLIDPPIHPPEHPTSCQFPIKQFIKTSPLSLSIIFQNLKTVKRGNKINYRPVGMEAMGTIFSMLTVDDKKDMNTKNF